MSRQPYHRRNRYRDRALMLKLWLLRLRKAGHADLDEQYRRRLRKTIDATTEIQWPRQ
jgi:hypothetical protein